MFKIVKKSLLGTTLLAGSAYAYIEITNDVGTKRSLQFWSNIFPIYSRYRWTQFLNRDMKIMSDDDADIRYNSYHEKYAEPVKVLTYEMRGFYLKQAQLMSLQDSFVPPQFMKWMKDTQDKGEDQIGLKYILLIL